MKLLQMIQPTPEKQKLDDERGIERAVSTAHSFVKASYKLAELRVVYRALKDGWDDVEMDSRLPKKGKDNMYA